MTGPTPQDAVAAATSPGWVLSARQRERNAQQRTASVRSVLIAAASTLVVVAVVVTVVTHASGWVAVRETFLSGADAREALPDVLRGLWLNIRLMVICEVAILGFGLLLAVLRTLRGPVFFPVRAAVIVYTDLFRGLPLIIVIYLLALGVPALRLAGVTDSFLFWGGASLVLTYSAYVAEVFRAGIDSVHPSQRAGARALGLTYSQSLRHVVLPQAIRRVVPPLLNDLVSLQKDSGLVSILGVADAVQMAHIHSAQSFNFTPYLVAAALFVALTIPMTRLTDYISARTVKRQGHGGLL